MTPPEDTGQDTEAAVDAAICADLREVGFEVGSVTELRNTYDRWWPDAIPVLVRWLPRTPTRHLKESVLRSLTVRSARKVALDAVLREFVEMDTSIDPSGYQMRWAAGNALETLWDDARYDDLRALAVDPAYGRGRTMVVRGLGRSKNPDAVPTLVSLLGDPDVGAAAAIALRRLKPAPGSGAREALEAAREGQEAWVRKEIDKTLAALP